MGWKEEYEKKLVTPEEAISVVKSGDLVVFTQGMEPFDLGLALTIPRMAAALAVSCR